ncbi:MAG: leucine-rich repeat protein, partial [Bacteroidaceae bacterium]|nr:leucine-rich repeat protein [Bacteroidaceae bacterium]
YMNGAYYNCTNLTTAVCGNNVTYMNEAYSRCSSLITAVCGNNVTSIASAYFNCTNIQGNTYFYSNSISGVRNCFYNRSSDNRLNIYVHAGTITNTRIRYTNSSSLVGTTITWTTDATNNCSYNTAYNLYIYHVANVEAARIANGDPDNMGNL